MAKVIVKIELGDELQEGDEYGIEDAIADALRNAGYNVSSVNADKEG